MAQQFIWQERQKDLRRVSLHISGVCAAYTKGLCRHVEIENFMMNDGGGGVYKN